MMEQVREIEYYKDLHKGEPIIVIGNGFTQTEAPLSWLNSNVTIGMNSFYKRDGLEVDYWALEGAGHLREEWERAERLGHVDKAGMLLVNRRFVQYFEHLPHVRSIDYVDDRNNIKKDFSYDPLVQHGSANSVMFFCLQLAYYLGGDPVLIVGLDHRFHEDGQTYHFYEEDGKAHVGPHGDFDQWAAKAEMSLKLCANVFRSFKRTLLNLSPGTALESIPKGDLTEWIQKTS